jgi:transcriptional regulator with XRE-family HTH domain
MKQFLHRLKTAIDNSEYKENLRQLSLKCELSPNRISNLLNDEQMSVSKVGPGFFTICRICEALDITPNYLAGLDALRISRPDPLSENVDLAALQALEAAKASIISGKSPPTVDQLMRLYAKGGGRIEAFSRVSDYFDVYLNPGEDGDRMIVHQVGVKSLASVTLAEKTAEVLQTALDSIDNESFSTRLLNDYKRAGKIGILLTNEELNVTMPNKPLRVKIDYTRLLLRLTDADGRSYIMNYSRLL